MADKVHIRRLGLTDFRNYTSLSLALDPRHVVITGANGAGKTNLMEAVSFLTPGRGLRRAAYQDVARSGSAGGFTVFAALTGMTGDADIGTAAGGGDDGTQRKLRIDGQAARTIDQLLDHARIAWLTPAMDGLFSGPAGDRRRFLDRMVLSIDPLHARRAIDYERAMRSRNRLLAEDRLDPSWLDGLEAHLAELAIAITLARRDFLDLLKAVIARMQDGEESGFPRAALGLDGFLNHDTVSNRAAVDLEGDLLTALRDGRRRDQAAGRTLDGPHREDLVVRHSAKDMPAALSSTGEQKALLIGLVLAHARLVADITGAAPILLLDEIAAHLDTGRRAGLFDLVHGLGGQAFMTGTDAAMFAALGERAQYLTIDNGRVKSASGIEEEL